MKIKQSSFFRLAGEDRIALRVTGGYLVLALLWIFISHFLPNQLSDNADQYLRLQFLLDSLLVVVTGGLLFWGTHRFLILLHHQEHRLYEMVSSACSATGDQFLQTLVRSLAEAVEADYAFVCEFTDSKREVVRTVAVYGDGRITENFEFELEGTPCGIVMKQGLQCYARNVRQKFPLDHLAQTLEVESYIGIPLVDSRGIYLGPMAVFSRSPLKKQMLGESMLRLFAVRAAAELERKKAEDTIDYMASYDSLTGLPNRKMFTEHLSQAISVAVEKKEMMAVLFIDLDRFKNINDTLGHAAGDWLLREVAGRLGPALRPQDMIARLSGDEFMIHLASLNSVDEVTPIAAKILKFLEPSFCYGGVDLHIASSVGIAIYPFDGRDAETLLKNADTALNRAKELGRNNYQFYTAEMNARTMARVGLEGELRKALEHGEFLLHFQPQLDLKHGRIEGVEALVRWQHPEKGLVGPVEFIGLSEETGLILPLGQWVLRSACCQMIEWAKAGVAVPKVAVNLSAIQFYQQDIVKVVADILDATGLPPDKLELEITESIIMLNIEETVDKLKRLRRLGVHIAIDDFGTGYSSLSYLRQFPIQTLKIDKSFVRDLGNNRGDSAIVEAIIAMARSLRLEVVAEGVETELEAQWLQDRGCNLVQGFLFSHPLPADRIPLLSWPIKAEGDDLPSFASL